MMLRCPDYMVSGQSDVTILKLVTLDKPINFSKPQFLYL